MNADQYVQLTPIEHIYTKPSFYVGSEFPTPRQEWIFDFNSGRMAQAIINLAQGVERLFLEPLSNAGDNVFKSRSQNIDPGIITVDMTPTTITITNGGIPIPVQINNQTNLYAPEMIFGHLLTSSNYSGTRSGCGMYGIGVKVTNVLSTDFRVEVGDPINGLQYAQEWGPKMTKRDEPQIMSYSGPPFVRVSYQMDFNRFGMQQYPPEALGLYYRRAADLSLNTRVPIIFNGVRIPASNLADYGRLFFGDVANLAFDPPIQAKRNKTNVSEQNIQFSVGLFDTPDHGSILGFVNGIPVDMGTHIKCVVNALLPFLDTINIKRRKKETSSVKLNKNDMLPHISIIVTIRVDDPEFVGATKSELSDPTLKTIFPEEVFKKLRKFKLKDRLYAALDGKLSGLMSKTDGKKNRVLDLEKGEDANLAGTRHSEECTLMVTEGDSAGSFAVEAISLFKNGRDSFGFYPLRGKVRNVMELDDEKFANNREISDLKIMLGLREKTNYLDPNNFKTLRYGRCLIMADEDVDGKHIKGLVINFFHCHYDTLLKRGFVMYLRTPILRVYRNRQVLKFYTQHEYNQWKDQMPEYSAWTHKYYKGLGTSTNKDIADEFKGDMGPRTVICLYDDQAPDSMRLAFDKKLADVRKAWIANWSGLFQTGHLSMQPISAFIHEEFIEYCVADIHRSIPSIVDGLKPSQRKIMWGAFMRWGHGLKTEKDSVKVAQFAAYVAERTRYHHGEKNLSDAIVNMAQDFVGSNNMPYFARDGQFGTRNMGGKDAASPRYIFTRPEWWVRLVFRKEDQSILKYVIDEGHEVEPETFLPIVPMTLINGAEGIAVGYSTYIPNHHPLQITAWLRSFLIDSLNGTQTPKPILSPWYRGFIGRIGSEKGSMITEGILKYSGCETLIEELPIGKWIANYTKWLNKQVKEKQLVNVRNLSTTTQVRFEVTRNTDTDPSLSDFKLVTKHGVRNMVLLNANNKPILYPDANTIIAEYAVTRLDGYRRRKLHTLDEIVNKIKEADARARFIMAILDGKLKVFRRAKKDIYPEMEQLDLPRELLQKVKTSEYTLDEVRHLQDEIKQLVTQHKEIERRKPEEIWLGELDEFERAYIEYYGA